MGTAARLSVVPLFSTRNSSKGQQYLDQVNIHPTDKSMDLKMIKLRWLICIGFCCITPALWSQCSPSTPSAGTGTNDNSIGAIPWDNLGNIGSSDNNYSTAGLLILGSNTNYLVASGFNLSIPNNATICGISVSIERSRSGIGTISDNAIYLYRQGNVVGSNHAVGGAWSGSDQVVTYGGENDLWGTSWTPTEVNSAGFGVAISAGLSLVSVLTTARIDQVTLSVYYSIALPVELTSFTAVRNRDSVELVWHTATETSQSLFQVERSDNGQDWYPRHTQLSTGNSLGHLYRYTDYNDTSAESFYRLSYHDLDGDLDRSNIEQVPPWKSGERLFLEMFPNPAHESVYIITEANVQYRISNLQGHILKEGFLNSSPGTLDLHDLAPGYYNISVTGRSGTVQKRLIKH